MRSSLVDRHHLRAAVTGLHVPDASGASTDATWQREFGHRVTPVSTSCSTRPHLHEKRNLRDGLLPSNRVRTTANSLNKPDSWNHNSWSPTYENRVIVDPRFPSRVRRFIDIRRGESSHVRQKWYGIEGSRHQPQKQVYATTQLGASDTGDGDRLMTLRLGKHQSKPAFSAHNRWYETGYSEINGSCNPCKQ